MATGNRTVDHIPGEEWRPIPGAAGWYSASSMGRVRRNEVSATGSDGRRLVFGDALMGYTVDSSGYQQVRFSRLCPYPRKLPLVHRVVFEAFRGVLGPGMEINHRNGVKTDNRIENLEPVTHDANMKHARRHGLMPVGDRAGRNKLSNHDALAVVGAFSAGIPVSHIARRFGVHQSTVSNLLSGRSWGAITGIPLHSRARHAS